jgi:hypothetical protein
VGAVSGKYDLKIIAQIDNFELVPTRVLALVMAIRLCQAFKLPSS